MKFRFDAFAMASANAALPTKCFEEKSSPAKYTKNIPIGRKHSASYAINQVDFLALLRNHLARQILQRRRIESQKLKKRTRNLRMQHCESGQLIYPQPVPVNPGVPGAIKSRGSEELVIAWQMALAANAPVRSAYSIPSPVNGSTTRAASPMYIRLRRVTRRSNRVKGVIDSHLWSGASPNFSVASCRKRPACCGRQTKHKLVRFSPTDARPR